MSRTDGHSYGKRSPLKGAKKFDKSTESKEAEGEKEEEERREQGGVKRGETTPKRNWTFRPVGPEISWTNEGDVFGAFLKIDCRGWNARLSIAASAL